LYDADADLLAGEGERDEDGFAFQMGEELAAVDGFGDFYELRLRGSGRRDLVRRDLVRRDLVCRA
jgi:hypothetical protein